MRGRTVSPDAARGLPLGARGGAALGVLLGLLWGILAAATMVHRNGLWRNLPDVAVLLPGLLALYGIAGALVGAVSSLAAAALPGRWGLSRSLGAGAAAGLLAVALLVDLRLDPDALPGRLHPLTAPFPRGPFLLGGISLLIALLAGGLARMGLTGRAIGRFGRVRGTSLLGACGVLVALTFVAAAMNLLRPAGEDGDHPEVFPLATGERPRIVLIGIDGATWRIMRPLMARGELPHFRRLVEGGASGPLASARPTLSPILWTSIATGVPPQRHGIAGFTVYPIPGLRSPVADFRLAPGITPLLRAVGLKAIPVCSEQRRMKAFWNILSEQGISVGVVSWWSTWPVEKVLGYMVSDRIRRRDYGYGGYLSGAVYPESLLPEVEPFIRTPDQVTEEEIGPLFRLRPGEMRALLDGRGETLDSLPSQALQILRVVYNTDLMNSSLGLHLYATQRPEVFSLYLSGIDAVEHGFFPWWEPAAFSDVRPADIERFGGTIPAYYAFIDGLIGKFLDLADERTVFCVISDHGQVPAPKGMGKNQVRRGVHDDAPAGIIVLAGPGIRRGVPLEGASIYDVLPTLLHLLDLPVGRDMKGRPLLEAMTSDGPGGRGVRFVSTYTPRAFHARGQARESVVDEEILARLRALGYIR